MEIFLKGVLDAVLTDHGVVRVIEQGVFLVLLLRHQADVAEDMRGVLGMVLSRERALDLDTIELVFKYGAYEFHARVLNENVLAGVDGVADVYRVAQTRDHAHLLGGVLVRDAVARTHIAHQLNGRGAFRQSGIFEVGGFIGKVRIQHCPLDFGHIGILKGRLSRYGQVVRIRIAEAAHHLDKLKDDCVRIVVCEQLRAVDNEVIAFLIAHKHTAVAVKNIAARGGDGSGILGYRGRAVVALGTLDYLHLIQKVDIYSEQRHQHHHERRYSSGFYKFSHRLFLIRSTSPAGNTPARRVEATTGSAMRR